MKKENRLLKNRDFKKVLDNKKSIASKEYIIYIKKNNIDLTRIGISVSSKIGNSVIRHKIKRQITEMLKDLVNFKENNDIVIIVRNNFLENSFITNKEKLKKLLTKF